MKIRLKAFSIVGLSSTIIILITLLILKFMFLDYIEKLEIDAVSHNFNHAESVMHRDQASLENVVLDWAQWDDTYQFIKDKNKRYIDVNLHNSTLDALNINFIHYYQKDYTLLYSLSDLNETADQMDSVFKNRLHLFDSIDRKCVTGMYKLGGRPLFVSVAPITTTDGLNQPDGYLIMGRYVEDDFAKYLKEVLQVDMNLDTAEVAEKQIEQTFIRYEDHNGAFWYDTTKETIISYKYLEDIYGGNSIVMTQVFKRNDHKNGLTVVNYFILFFFSALLIITFTSFFMMDKLVTNRLKKFHDFMWNVGKTRDTSARIAITGTDEIAELGFLTNNMLLKLDESYEELKNIKERFRLTLESTNDGYLDANLITNDVYVSPAWLSYLGFDETKSNIDIATCVEAIVKEDRSYFIKTLKRCINKEIDFLRAEIRILKRNNEVLWIVVRGKVVQYDDEGAPIRFICTIFDISERKKFEGETIFLSQTDVVTGLKNRAYLEDIINKTEEGSGENTWIIMGDVNGLKLINDSFGHSEGDRLLKTIGAILMACCTKGDIPARWGGDEFVVYVRNKEEEYVENLMNRITKACEEVKGYPIKVSISLGYANRGEDMKSLGNVLKRAEERMYRHKLLESRSTRSNIISSLEQTLNEKDIETLEHTKRIRKMCVKVGNRMGLSHEEMDELVLLGALHDIGKVGIPESILMKSDKLTEEEWVIMKKHTEIGYRIAAATPELAHIADEILYHHERFDGKGYPHGLSGREIPKLARIISVVDSFDVMTHDRVYKAAMTVEEAVKELEKCSDKQFDPEIVEQFISSLNLKKLNIKPKENQQYV